MKTISIKIGNIPFEVEYQYKPEVPGVFNKRPEDCYETEPAELYIESIQVNKGYDLKDIVSESAINEMEEFIKNFEGN